METCIEEIIKLEWEQFQKVNNEGGKASCQQDYTTFYIMRKSQFLSWNEEVLQSYKNDLYNANQNNWNLLTEKYARMMESTDIEQYKRLEPYLPVLSDQRKDAIEKAVKQLVKWEEEFVNRYPNLSSKGRKVHTSEDTKYQTSFETYARGELGTYSDQTFYEYEKMIETYLQMGKNLSYEIMMHEVAFYGYKTIEDADKRMSM